MPSRESKLSLEHDLPAVVEHLATRDGKVEADSEEEGVYWLTLHPLSASDETYFVRVAWTEYPLEPPSVKFADGVEGRLDVTRAWPMVPGYRPGNFDICQPFTAEGFVAHPEWRTSAEAWTGSGNPFLWVATTLQNDLDNRYQGRSG